MKSKNLTTNSSTKFASLLLLLFAIPSILAQNPAAELTAGRALERPLKVGETHSYKIRLEAGEFLRVTVEQEGVDVAVRLFAPDGKLLALRDWPNGTRGEESLSAEAGGAAGVYRLDITGGEEDAAGGKYSLRSEAPRRPTAADKQRIAAENAFQEAERLSQIRMKDSKLSALTKYEEALSAWMSLKDAYVCAMTLSTMAFIESGLGDNQQALKLFTQALPLHRQAGDKRGEALTLNNISITYADLGDNQQALKFLNEALPLFRATGDKRGEASALSNIGKLYADLGDNRQALKFDNESLLVRRQISNRGAESYTFYDKRGEAYTLNNIGAVYAALGDKQQALKFYNEALALFRSADDKGGEALMLDNIGTSYSALGDKQQALKFHNEALLRRRQVGDKSGEATTLNHLGNTYKDLGDNEQAVKFYNEALLLGRRVGEKRGEARTLNNLMNVWEKQNNRRLAILYGKQSVNIYQALRANIKTLDKDLQKTFLKSFEKTYRKLSDILIAEGRILEAEQVLNLLKTEEFGTVLRRGAAPEALLPYSAAEEAATKIIDRLAALAGERGELLALKNKGPLPAGGEARLAELEAQLTAANAEFRRSLENLARETNTGFDLKQAQTLQSDLRELGAGTVALYTLIVCGDDSPLETSPAQKSDVPVKQCENVRTGWIILITPDFRKAYPIDVHELNQTVAVLRQALSSDKYDPVPAAQKLYDKMFRQTSVKQKTTLEADLNEYFARIKATDKTLMWSLDGILRYIPMGVLHDGKKYLIEKYRTTIFTTASFSRLKDANKPNWTAFGLGISEAREGFSALPGVRRELLAIVRDDKLKNTNGIMSGTIRLDSDFTRKAMLDGLQRGYPVVHLASHFSYKNKQEDSFLLLGDGHLRLGEMRDFPQIFENVDLLTLSACNTATSDADNGKEVEGLGVVAQSLGAKSVIASLWEVADTGTDQLMTRFYKLRSANPEMSKGEAFRQAQLELLGAKMKYTKASDSNRAEIIDPNERKIDLPPFVKDVKHPFAHPHYWSSFVLIGNWR